MVTSNNNKGLLYTGDQILNLTYWVCDSNVVTKLTTIADQFLINNSLIILVWENLLTRGLYTLRRSLNYCATLLKAAHLWWQCSRLKLFSSVHLKKKIILLNMNCIFSSQWQRWVFCQSAEEQVLEILSVIIDYWQVGASHRNKPFSFLHNRLGRNWKLRSFLEQVPWLIQICVAPLAALREEITLLALYIPPATSDSSMTFMRNLM